MGLWVLVFDDWAVVSLFLYVHYHLFISFSILLKEPKQMNWGSYSIRWAQWHSIMNDKFRIRAQWLSYFALTLTKLFGDIHKLWVLWTVFLFSCLSLLCGTSAYQVIRKFMSKTCWMFMSKTCLHLIPFFFIAKPIFPEFWKFLHRSRNQNYKKCDNLLSQNC